jgi:hypothetical protein
MIQNEIMEEIKCISCDAIIHPKRLQILPNTKCCVNCSEVGRKRGVTIQLGEGDHTYNDLVIMSEKQYFKYVEEESKAAKGQSKSEIIDFDNQDETNDIISRFGIEDIIE